jgi:hypothetical protein
MVGQPFEQEGQNEDHKVLKGQKFAQKYRTGQKNGLNGNVTNR